MSPRPYVLAVLACIAVAGCAVTGAPEDRRTDLAVSGNAAFPTARLRAVVAESVDLEAREYRRSAIDDAAFAIEEYYASRGYPFCTVEYEVYETPRAGARAGFAVTEGPRTRLARVELNGNAAYSEENLLAFLDVPEADGERLYVKRAVDNAARAIAAYYYSEGYLDVRVAQPAVELAPDRRSAQVRIDVEEGVRYRLTAVRMEGDPFPAPDWKGLVGEPYTPQQGVVARGRLREALGAAGHPEARVDLEEERDESGGVVLVATLTTGPRVTISGVRIEGNAKTRTRRIESSLSLEVGEAWSLAKERESFLDLYQSGLFSSVGLALEGEGSERTLVVNVVELPSTELYVEPGYGSYERLRLGVGWRENNLFGTGRVLDVTGTVSELARRGQVDLTDRRLLGSDVQGNLSVFTNTREEPSFTSRELGTGVTFSRSFTERVRGSLGYQFRRSEVSDVKVIGPQVAEALEDVDVSSVFVSPSYDSRDDVFTPDSGSLSRLTLEVATQAIGSEIDFVRANVRQASFYELRAGTVLGLAFRAGLIAPIGGTDTIPLQERYFNGGENTVRSFREDELGPLDAGGEPVGGEAYTVLTVELRQDIAARLEGALFLDVGNLQSEWRDVLSFEDLESAVGVGLRYMLPVGPLRLDLGVNPDPAAGADDAVLHFSVGMSF